MDLLQTGHNYVARMAGSGGETKLKVMLLDKDTTSIISLCATQSQLLKHQIYLIDRIDNRREKMRHLNCICFVRATGDSIQWLVDELRAPRYASYELYFCNVVKKSYLERLAESDDFEVVTKVQELFLDYFVINKYLFSLNMFSPMNRIFSGNGPVWDHDGLIRTTEGLVAALLATRTKPIIRYDRNSAMAKKLAQDVSNTMKQESKLFEFKRRDTPPILLIIDRKNDPVTPLLMPWTYQAMVHEMLGIDNNRVDMNQVPDVSEDQKQIVLSADQDAFFAKTMYLNFGDLGVAIKDYVQQYQAKTKSSSKLESISDMKRFVENYPEFRRLSGNVSKHVALVGELSRLVSAFNLLQTSELEQSLACNDNNNNHHSDLRTLDEYISSPSIASSSKVRLVALYALRYQFQANNAIDRLMDQVRVMHPESIEELDAVRTLIERYGGGQDRQERLYGSDSFFAKAQSGIKGLKGVENVYTQHTPLLKQTLQNLIKGRLKRSTQPYYDDGTGSLPSWTSSDEGERPQQVIVFVVGGATYEEARIVAELNESNKTGGPGVQILLGTTAIHNSKTFLNDIYDGGLRWPQAKPTNAEGRLSALVH